MKINVIGMILNNAGRRSFEGAMLDDAGRPMSAADSLHTLMMEYANAFNGGESKLAALSCEVRIPAQPAATAPTRGLSTPWGEADDSGEQAYSDEPVAEALPHPGSPEASAMIDSVLDEYEWPSNTKNAARAGYVAAGRLMQWARKPLPDFEAPPSNPAAQWVGSLPDAPKPTLFVRCIDGNYREALPNER